MPVIGGFFTSADELTMGLSVDEPLAALSRKLYEEMQINLQCVQQKVSTTG